MAENFAKLMTDIRVQNQKILKIVRIHFLAILFLM